MSEDNAIERKDYYKWILLFLLWIAFFLHQGTRQIYNAILPQIQGSFGVDSMQMGLVGTVFVMTYGICAMPAGMLGDKFSKKRILIAGLTLFCLGIFSSGLVASIGVMILSYGLLNGVGQALYGTASYSMIGQFHEESRGTALAIYQTAVYVGIVVCSLVSGYFGDIHNIGTLSGWRIPFIFFGGIGLIWALILVFFIKDSKPSNRNNSVQQKVSIKKATLVFFKKPSAILLAFAFGMQVYVDCGFKTWMPTFFREYFNMDGTQSAFNAVIWHYVGAFIGVMIGGRLTDKLVKKRPTIRFEANIIGLVCGAPFIFLMANSKTEILCFFSLFLFGVFRGFYDSNLFASLYEIIDLKYRATATGIMLCFAFIIGSTAPTVLGWMRDEFGMSQGISSLSIFYFIGGIAVLCARNFFFKKDRVQQS